MAKVGKRGRKAPPRARRKPAAPPQRSGERYELAMRAINEGVYDWDVASGTIYYSEGVYSVLQMPRSVKTPADWRRRIHPDDLPEYDAAIRAHFRKQTRRFECDYRYRTRGGGWRWARQHGIAQRDARGRVIRMIGSTGDITEFKRVEQELKESQERYALATQAATEGIYEWNLETGSLYLSDRAKVFFAVKGKKLSPASWNARVHRDDFAGYRDAVTAYFKGRALQFEREYRIRNATGGYAWVMDRAVAVRDSGGRVIRFVGALSDITQRKLHELELRRARDEATEALERQTATAEILKVIAGSPTDVQPVFDTIARNAVALCGSWYANVFRFDGELLHWVASHGRPERMGGAMARKYPMRPDPSQLSGRAMLARSLVYTEDTISDPDYDHELVGTAARRMLGAPMLRDGNPVGAIVVGWAEPGKIPIVQQELLKTFADQAVIAIENVRLFNETREALERQTATAEILKVISASPTDVQPVFDAIVTSARQLIGGYSAVVTRVVDDSLHLVAFTATDESGVEAVKAYYPRPTSVGYIGKAIRTRAPVFVSDHETDPEIPPEARELARVRGYRSLLMVPMVREEVVIGLIHVTRGEPGPFTDHQINLLKTFADQAVIAIENVRLFNETKEALAQQTATAEILRVIGGSMTDAQPVFDAIVKNCSTLFKGSDVVLRVVRDGRLDVLASVDEALHSIPIDQGSAVGACVLEARTIHLPDIEAAADRFPRVRQLGLKRGFRSGIYAPLLRGGVAIGTIGILRPEVGAFADKEVALLTTFADQAVIAIENVRLFKELEARNRDVTEALEQQTATAEILSVISSSPTNVQPVFDAIAASALHLFGGLYVAVVLVRGDKIEIASTGGVPEIVAKARSAFPIPLDRESVTGRVIVDRAVQNMPDMEDPALPEFARALSRGVGVRALLGAPMLREGAPIGAIMLMREHAGEFSAKQTSLLKTFADQAVIAIENVRLFNETKEALERQTATAEILKVIAGSPTDVQPVFDVIVESAVRLCGARFGRVYRYDGSVIQMVAGHGLSTNGLAQVQRVFPRPAADDTIVGRVILMRRPFYVRDIEREETVPALSRQVIEALGTRSQVTIPMLRAGQPIGAITMGWVEPEAFDDQQVALLQTFADQAVIAIENVRLFNETKEALERQTATAEILRVIASSPSDVQPVFDAIARSANQLIGGFSTAVARLFDDALHLVAYTTTNEAGDEALKSAFPMPVSSTNVIIKVVRTGVPVCVSDTETDSEISSAMREVARARGYRSMLIVPLLRERAATGIISVTRLEPGGFSSHQIELLKTFADQAVIAIENVRLFNETKEALERQTATAEILKVISESPTNVQPVFDAIASSCVQLFGGQNVALVLVRDQVIDLAAFATPNDMIRGEFRENFPLPISQESVSGRAILRGAVVHVPDMEADPLLGERAKSVGRRFGYRDALCAPMIRDGKAIGAIAVVRSEPGTYTEKQIGLLETFANQAVIAIENVRLFKELEARNSDLGEALEQQTATAEILRVISSTPTDTRPVFDAIVQSALRIFDGMDASILLVEGDRIQLVAAGGSVDFEERRRRFPVPLDRETVAGRAILDGAVTDVGDTEASHVTSWTREYGRKMGYRAITNAPLLREGVAIGAIAVARKAPGALNAKRLDLLKTFADQAVIAIENVRLFNETKEALERQTATAEILNVIASSPADVQPVFDAIAKSAYRLIGGFSTAVARVFDDVLHLVAFSSTDEAGNEALKHAFPVPVSRSKAARTGEPVAISDTEALPDSASAMRELARTRGFRSILIVPMVRESVATGTINVTRREPGEFSNHQVDLLRTFADQAVIAIENVRLFNETKEALERQTATAEILQVIGSSPTDTQPVFDAIVNSGLRLFPGAMITVARPDGGTVRAAAIAHEDTTMVAGWRDRFTTPLSRDRLHAAAILDAKLIDFPDAEAEKDGPLGPGVRNFLLSGNRAVTIMPMLRGEGAIGAISVTRAVPGPLSDKQIAILRTFADQAVIAIENVRLFNETKEALERQTATAEILKVIASSPSNVQPVFDAIVESAARLFGRRAGLRVVDGNVLRRMARSKDRSSGFGGAEAIPIDRDSLVGSVALDGKAMQVVDTRAPDAPPYARAHAHELDFRANATAPLVREGAVIGVISVSSTEPGALSAKELALLTTFADQAVIAIENVRLFKELEARTEALTRSVGQLTALGEVGQAISSTLDLETVLKTIVSRAIQLAGLDGGVIYEYDEPTGRFELRASENFDDDSVAGLRGASIRKGEGAVGASVATREPTEVPDTHAPDYPARLRELLDRAGFRAVLAVPLLREDQIIGALMVLRKAAGPFAPEIVDFLKTFASQSALAIQNARLFREIAEKGKQLEVASRHKSDFLASMSHELRTPLNAILGFNEMILGQIYGEVPADMQEPLTDIQTSGKHLLRLINNVLDLAKIEAGRMELSLQDYSVQDTVESVRSTLRPLAVEKGLEFLANVPNDMPLAYGDGGRIAQCLMNLAGNSLKFTKAGKVEISAETRGELLVYKVADTGIGIPPDKLETVFAEFKQTDATIASEYGGTGLGLSISKKFVEMHGGRIWVESELGKGSAFIIEVPLRVKTI